MAGISTSARGANTDNGRMTIWCEHCRDHFDVDHYTAHDEHKVGKDFGPVGRDLLVQRAVVDVIRAVEDKGPAPAFHDATMAKHRSEWPTLWAAIDKLREAVR